MASEKKHVQAEHVVTSCFYNNLYVVEIFLDLSSRGRFFFKLKFENNYFHHIYISFQVLLVITVWLRKSFHWDLLCAKLLLKYNDSCSWVYFDKSREQHGRRAKNIITFIKHIFGDFECEKKKNRTSRIPSDYVITLTVGELFPAFSRTLVRLAHFFTGIELREI